MMAVTDPEEHSAWVAPLHLVAQPMVSLATGSLWGIEILTRVTVAHGPTPRPDQYWQSAVSVDPEAAWTLDRWVWREALRYADGLGVPVFVNTTPSILPNAPGIWAGHERVPTGCEITRPGFVSAPGWVPLAGYQRSGGLVVWDGSVPEDLESPWPVTANLVKIPRRYSHGIASTSTHRQHSVAAWMDRIHEIGALVVALGVEQPEDAQWMVRHHADVGQGFYWGAIRGLGVSY